MTRWGLGVDLGTSFAAGAVAAHGRVELLEVGGDRRVPSTVLLTEDGRLIAGSYAQRAVGRLPDRAERNPTRYVGRAPMLLGGQPVSAVDALAAVLALFVGEARRRHDDSDPDRIALSHPTAWGPDKRAALREAAERVLPRVATELVEEPVAAALHYAHELPVDGDVAVYDLGGTTFDATVLTPDGSGFRVLGRPGGDPDLGGEIFDQLVYRHFGDQLAHAAPQWWEQLSANPDGGWIAAEADLLAEARLAKEALSERETANPYVAGADVNVGISRAELDALIGDDVRRSVRILGDTAAGADLRAVFLTGGASRTPLVVALLHEAHGALVRTRSDPKAAVALGAARLALGGVAARPAAGGVAARPASGGVAAGEVATRPAKSPPVPPPGADRPDLRRVPVPPPADAGPPAEVRPYIRGLVPVAEHVLDARIVAGRLYTWSAPDGPAGGHRIARIDPRSGRADREIRLGRLVGWAVSAAGVVVAERRDGDLHCHTLGSDLSVASSAPLPTPYRPYLLAEGPLAWAVLRSPDTRLVSGQHDGELGALAVQAFPLGAGPGAPPGPVVPMGPAAYWYVDGERRRLDPLLPTSSAPALFGDGRSCAVVIGRPAAPGHRGGPPRQTLCLVGPTGEVTQVAEQPALPTDTPWAQQVLGAAGRWLLATSIGLESYADLRHGTDRRLFLPRPPAGAVRWVTAGRQAYGLAVDRLSPGAGFSLHALVDGRRRELGRWPSLLGTPAAARPDDAARVRADADRLLVGTGDGSGHSQLVAADAVGARVIASAPGWLEPVGRMDGALLARHVPGTAPGDGCAEAGSLVRIG